MLQIKSLRTDVRMETTDLRRILTALSATEWKPALLESQKKVLELAGVEGQVPLPITRSLSLYGPHLPSDAFAGDVFFRGNDVFFLLSSHGEGEMLIRRAYAMREAVAPPSTGMEVGIMTNNGNDIDQRLHAFAEAFQQCTTASLDGRKTRHMQFAWQPSVVGTPRLDKIMGGEPDGTSVKFGKPEIPADELRGAQALANEGTRTMLTELSQAGFARAQDILSRKGKKQQEAESAIDSLKGLDMLAVEYLLECRRTGTPLTHLAAKFGQPPPEDGG